MPLALGGIKVVDCAQGVSGPFCAMQLGDLGADVVKLEPVTGDWLRGIGPHQEGEGAVFLQVNRNKRGIAVDLKTDAGGEILERLVSGADVFIEGYRPGKMEALGFGYEAVGARNSRLVYCSVSGYGQTGPLAHAPATELEIQAMVGANRHLGTPHTPPLRYGFDLASTMAGMSAFQGVMAALLWRERTGVGQHVETSLLAAFIALHQFTFTGESPQFEGSRAVTGQAEPPDHGWATADGPALIHFWGDEAGWTSFLIAIDRPELLLDERFNSPEALLHNAYSCLPALINDTLIRWRFEDLRRLVQDELGGTIVRMNNFDSLVDDPQVAALGMIRPISGHPVVGEVSAINVPWTFQEELAALRRPAPTLGQHTLEVLRELEYEESRIGSIIGAGAAVQWAVPEH